MMKNSRIPDAWLKDAVTKNPIRRLTDSTGQFTGLIRTCPVRLSFASLLKPRAARPGFQGQGQGGPEKYEATLLFPPGVDYKPLTDAYYDAVKKHWPGNPVADDGSVPGLHSPFRRQDEKANLAGYTPGQNLFFIRCTSQFPPGVVDLHNNPIVDEKRVYSGVWAVMALNTYKYPAAQNMGTPGIKKGIGFGLTAAIIVADDENLGGAGIDPGKAFAGIDIDASFDASTQFDTALPQGGSPSGGQQPGFQTMPTSADDLM